MLRSSDIAHREDPLDRLFDEIARQIIEAPLDWRRLTIRRPGDERKWGRAA